MGGRVAGALVVAVLLAPAQAAHAADPTFSATASPSPMTALTERIAYRLEMTSGSELERFWITLRRPSWTGVPVGSPIWFSLERRYVQMEGAGVLRGGVEMFGELPGPLCTRGFDHPHHPLVMVEVVLPPSSTSTLVIDADAGATLPFFDTDQGLRFEIGQVGGTTPDAGLGSLAAPLTLVSPSPRFEGPVAPRITLAYKHVTDIPGERRIRIRGSTEPRLRSASIELHVTDRAPVTLRTNAHGRFILRRFRIPRSYTEVRALYTGGERGVAAGASCPLRFGRPPAH